jgi:hypothetical protein
MLRLSRKQYLGQVLSGYQRDIEKKNKVNADLQAQAVSYSATKLTAGERPVVKGGFDKFHEALKDEMLKIQWNVTMDSLWL